MEALHARRELRGRLVLAALLLLGACRSERPASPPPPAIALALDEAALQLAGECAGKIGAAEPTAFLIWPLRVEPQAQQAVASFADTLGQALGRADGRLSPALADTDRALLLATAETELGAALSETVAARLAQLAGARWLLVPSLFGHANGQPTMLVRATDLETGRLHLARRAVQLSPPGDPPPPAEAQILSRVTADLQWSLTPPPGRPPQAFDFWSLPQAGLGEARLTLTVDVAVEVLAFRRDAAGRGALVFPHEGHPAPRLEPGESIALSAEDIGGEGARTLWIVLSARPVAEVPELVELLHAPRPPAMADATRTRQWSRQLDALEAAGRRRRGVLELVDRLAEGAALDDVGTRDLGHPMVLAPVHVEREGRSVLTRRSSLRGSGLDVLRWQAP